MISFRKDRDPIAPLEKDLDVARERAGGGSMRRAGMSCKPPRRDARRLIRILMKLGSEPRPRS